MALFGVLLGIEIAALVVIWFVMDKRTHELASLFQETWDEVLAMQDRIAVLENRKPAPLAADAATEQQPRPKLRFRTWNEDAVMPEGTK